jgi:uncharacterized protein (TIGR02246 family)
MQRLLSSIGVFALVVGVVSAADPEPRAAEEAAIRKSVEAYVAAFNQADAKTLASMWSPEAVYSNPVSGEEAVGREAIEAQFVAIFTETPGIKLAATTTSIEFVSPNVAIEKGVAQVTRQDQAAEESEYSAVYIKREGQWLLDRVTEAEVPQVSTQYEHLKELEWMIGTWVDQDEESQIITRCQWSQNQNFIIRFFSVNVRDQLQLSGLQIVGWDPQANKIRSWVFDSDGGFGEGMWVKKDASWHVNATGILPDGGKSTSVQIIRLVDDNTFTWQVVNREVDGELLPNVDEVVVVRQEE